MRQDTVNLLKGLPAPNVEVNLIIFSWYTKYKEKPIKNRKHKFSIEIVNYHDFLITNTKFM